MLNGVDRVELTFGHKNNSGCTKLGFPSDCGGGLFTTEWVHMRERHHRFECGGRGGKVKIFLTLTGTCRDRFE